VDKAVRQQRALALWAETVGDTISRVSTAKSIANGRLFVEVSNPTWRAELFQRREDIRCRLNTTLGADDVQEIVLV